MREARREPEEHEPVQEPEEKREERVRDARGARGERERRGGADSGREERSRAIEPGDARLVPGELAVRRELQLTQERVAGGGGGDRRAQQADRAQVIARERGEERRRAPSDERVVLTVHHDVVLEPFERLGLIFRRVQADALDFLRRDALFVDVHLHHGRGDAHRPKLLPRLGRLVPLRLSQFLQELGPVLLGPRIVARGRGGRGVRAARSVSSTSRSRKRARVVTKGGEAHAMRVWGQHGACAG